MKLIVIILSAFLLNSCACAKTSTNAVQDEMNKIDSQEQLSGVFTVTLLKNSIPKVENITLNFDKKQNRVSGFSGCNTYSGGYTVKGNSLIFGNIIATRMYCDDTDKTERLVLECLSKTNSFILEKNKLVLKADGVVLLNAEKDDDLKQQVQIKEKTLVVYDSHARGYYYNVSVYETYITVLKQRGDAGKIIKINKDQSNSLRKVLSSISLEKVGEYKDPTQKRFYDGAPHTTITIIRDGKSYKSKTFDGGFPPKELEVLVNKVLSLAPEK